MSAAASDVSSDVHVIFPLIASASDSTHIALPHRKTECPCNHLQCLLLSHNTSQVPTTQANLAIPRRRLATKWLAWDACRVWSPDDADLRSLGIVDHSQFSAGHSMCRDPFPLYKLHAAICKSDGTCTSLDNLMTGMPLIHYWTM